MEDRYKWITLAQKIKELSEKGEGGEKVSAELHLKRLMQKHNITLEELQNNQRKDFDLKISKDIPTNFVMQVLASVIGSIKKYGSGLGQYKNQSVKYNHLCVINIEPCLFYEFKYKLDFYWDDYQKQSKTFYDAYIQKNRLYTKPDETIDLKDKQLSREEIQRLIKVFNMMESIDIAEYQKRISNGKG